MSSNKYNMTSLSSYIIHQFYRDALADLSNTYSIIIIEY